ncbi:MAG: hypothetical protein NTV21_09455 [Planctomycetota bacterium]|nr:hypothetical protein [Planctomycetota bacterium]
MPEAAPTRSTDWYGRNRRWLWIAVALGVWLLTMAAAYVVFAGVVSRNLAEARADLEQSLARLPKPASVAKAGVPKDTARAQSSMDWIARMGGAIPGAIGHQTMPPRVPGGIARTLTLPSEVFLTQTHYGITSASSSGPQKAAPECSQVDPEILGDEMRLANWRAELEDKPTQLRANRACYAVVAGWQDLTETIPSETFDADQLVHTPSAQWFEMLEREGLPAPMPSLCGAVLAARRLADSAVYHAAKGETQTAREHLSKALAACDALCGLEWITGFAAWTEAEIQVLERACLCMALLESTGFPPEFDAHVAALEPRERYLAAIPGELRLVERDFERAKNGLSSRVRMDTRDDFGAGPMLSLQMDQELADTLRTWLADLPRAEVAPYSSGGPLPMVRSALSSNQFGFKLTPPGLGSQHPWGELAALKELVQLARIATRDGAAAAQQAAASILDPFSGKPLASRLEPDGTLVLWSVGEDRKDDNAQPRLTCDPKADIVVRVPTR